MVIIQIILFNDGDSCLPLAPLRQTTTTLGGRNVGGKLGAYGFGGSQHWTARHACQRAECRRFKKHVSTHFAAVSLFFLRFPAGPSVAIHRLLSFRLSARTFDKETSYARPLE